MLQLSDVAPSFLINDEGLDQPSKDLLRTLFFAAEQIRAAVSGVINFNAILFISQAARPTPSPGAFILWKDSDAWLMKRIALKFITPETAASWDLVITPYLFTAA